MTNNIYLKRKNNFKRKISPYLFIAPYLIFFFTFAFVPVILSIVISFLKWDFVTEAKWVGFDNYKLIFDSESLTYEYFWSSVKHTLLFVAIEAPILIVLPLIVALLLNAKIKNNPLKGSKLFRALIYFPAIFSVSTVATVFYVLLDTNIGMINVFTGKSTPWLTSQPFQWISIFLMSTWWGIGGNMIYYTAGLGSISIDLYEAADMDGANTLQKFFYVTIPSLKQTFIYVVIMTILSTFNVMGQPMMLTSGEESTKVAMQYIYEVAFGGTKFGRATAMSIVMTVFMATFSILSFKLITKKGDKE